jgi:hypothetical protein
MICFILFVRILFPYWLWHRVIPYTLFRLRRTAGVTGQQKMLIPPFAFVGGPCCLTPDFVFTFWIMITFYTLLTSLFCIVMGTLEICMWFFWNVRTFFAKSNVVQNISPVHMHPYTYMCIFKQECKFAYTMCKLCHVNGFAYIYVNLHHM